MRFLFRSHLLAVLPALLLLPLFPVAAQTAGARKNVQITFLPPPLENASFSLGIYEVKSGKLVRRLHEAATESAFTAGLNGLITRWDGKDDEGKPVPPGRYAARGYGVGPLKVEGVEFLGNDWTDEDDSLRIKYISAIALVPEDDGLMASATLSTGGNMLLRFAGGDGKLLWKHPLPSPTGGLPSKNGRNIALVAGDHGVAVIQPYDPVEMYRLADGSKLEVPAAEADRASGTRADALDLQHARQSGGKDATSWLIADNTLYQLPAGSNPRELLGSPGKITDVALRGLKGKENEPPMHAVSASGSHDRLYLLEESPGWQRVRGLSWVETKQEDGKTVSDWETFFERNIRQSIPEHGLADPVYDKPAPPPAPVKLMPVENPLIPGKTAAVELVGGFDEKGSYLALTDGLRLRKISQQPALRAVKLVKGESPGTLTLFQNDGAAWEEFSVAGANQMMSFDAGEFEMTANGEKPVETRAAEVPDL